MFDVDGTVCFRDQAVHWSALSARRFLSWHARAKQTAGMRVAVPGSTSLCQNHTWVPFQCLSGDWGPLVGLWLGPTGGLDLAGMGVEHDTPTAPAGMRVPSVPGGTHSGSVPEPHLGPLPVFVSQLGASGGVVAGTHCGSH